MKKTYVAIFADGQRIERNSSKEFTHAYAVTFKGQQGPTGFAATADKAQRAAANDRARIARIQKTDDVQIEVVAVA